MTTNLHVLFRVGEADYVVPVDAVLEMESYAGATRVPGAAEHVAGLVQIRGRVLPVVDLRRRFALPPIEHGLDARVIVVRDGVRRVGLLADRAREIVALDPASFRAPPDVVARDSAGFVTSIGDAGGRIVMRLDVGRVVGTDGIPGEEEERDGTQA